MSLVKDILSKLESADNSTKNELENSLVKMGAEAIPHLIDRLQAMRGMQRGVAAMTLIRIGGPSVEYLRKAARANKDFEWVAQYLIREIECLAA